MKNNKPLKGKNHKINCKCNFCSKKGSYSKGMLGKKHSEETKQKIRESKIGDKNPMFNKDFSEEHRRKLKENNPHYWMGRKRDYITKKKISKKLTGRKLSKKINQIQHQKRK